MRTVRLFQNASPFVLAAILVTSSAAAQDASAPGTATLLPKVEVTAKKHVKPARKAAPASTPATAPAATPTAAATSSPRPATTEAISPGKAVLTGAALADAVTSTNDIAKAITVLPGVFAASGGGASSLPVIDGMSDDEIAVKLSNMDIAAACGNHMNPPLSYADPAGIGSVEVLRAVSPVSSGGDAIGGAIIVEPKIAAFAETDAIAVHGFISATASSNGSMASGAAEASMANRDWSVDLSGADVSSNDYKAGGGGVVKSTDYQAGDYLLTIAHRLGDGRLTLSAGIQNIPRQSFPNELMDMVYNRSWFANARYETPTAWGALDLSGYFQRVDHYMNIIGDKGTSTPTSGMPMYTRGVNTGYEAKATIDLGKADTLRIGNEFHHEGLNDWWTGMAKSMMMGPNTYVNINDGRRDRFALYGEWDHTFSKEWSSDLGARIEAVDMNTGIVQAYNSKMDIVDYRAAQVFNGENHHKTDVNLDLTALARWAPSDTTESEFGYARKTRSPNLYERYAWGRGAMAASMIGWYGDGNGYVGNPGLKPEIANTFEDTWTWHDPSAKLWSIAATPYVSYVQDYIDANTLGSITRYGKYTFSELQFANHDALIEGVTLEGRTMLVSASSLGDFGLTAKAAYTHGENLDTHDGLYRIMPLSGTIALDHTLGDWSNSLSLDMAAAKTDVSSIHREEPTPGYAVMNWKTSYHWRNLDVSLGVNNIFDHLYALPLGGLNLANAKSNLPIDPLEAPGRTVYGSLKLTF